MALHPEGVRSGAQALTIAIRGVALLIVNFLFLWSFLEIPAPVSVGLADK
jgi:hypothetical protein